ncbi:MAG: TIM barrel protein [Chloroflexota bacterium]
MLLFGTAGIPLSTPVQTTAAGIEHIRALGLDCLEVQFVRGVKMGTSAARLVQDMAQQNKVRLSVHAPYYINLNAKETEKLAASEAMLLQSARVGHLCGANTVVFHAGVYFGNPPPQVYQRVKETLVRLTRQLRQEGNDILLRPEVMGKSSQFGTLEELLNLSSEVQGIAPTLDLSHWHARTGNFNSYEAFSSVFDLVESTLGQAALGNLHFHLSGIAYSKAGELKHLLLDESDMKYKELLKVMKERQIGGTVICESPNLEEDALLLQQTYREI